MRAQQIISVVALVAMGVFKIARATEIVPTPLSTEVREAAVIVIGRVDEVTMHGSSGQTITDPAARTGPKLPNELRLHITLDSKRVLKGKIDPERTQIVLPLWKSWHSSLAFARETMQKQDFVFFLTADLKPQRLEDFVHLDLELPEIQREIQNTKEPNKALVPTATSVTPAADAPVAPAAAAAHL